MSNLNAFNSPYSHSSLITLHFNINQTHFKFSIKLNIFEFIGDLRALVREIILRTIRAEDSSHNAQTAATIIYPTNFAFINNRLFTLKSSSKLSRASIGPDLACLLHKIVNNDEDFFIKMYSNGQEFTSFSQSTSIVLDAKKLIDLGVKDGQTINVSLFSRINSPIPSKITRECVPMLILSEEANFKSLFNLLNVLAKSSIKQNGMNKWLNLLLQIINNLKIF